MSRVALDAEPGFGMHRVAHVTGYIGMSRMFSHKSPLDDGTVAPGTLAAVMLIELDGLWFMWVVTTGAVQHIRAVRQTVAVAACGQVAVLDVAVITFECRVHASAFFDGFVLRDVAGAASAAVQTWIVDPFHRRMRVRMTDRATLDGCTVSLGVASPTVWQVAMLYVAEGAVQRCMFATPVLKGMVLWRMAVHTLHILKLLVCAFTGWRHR